MRARTVDRRPDHDRQPGRPAVEFVRAIGGYAASTPPHQEIASVLDLFRRRHPRCELRMREIPLADPLGRSGT